MRDIKCEMPAGDYYIGDLCYVMHDEWDEVLELFFDDRNDNDCNEGVFTLKDGRKFVSFNTRYGDGTYRDQYGNFYHVDAGLIGCILVEDIKEEIPPSGTNIVQFKYGFSCHSDGSTLRFGHLAIDTDPSYEEEEEETY